MLVTIVAPGKRSMVQALEIGRDSVQVDRHLLQ